MEFWNRHSGMLMLDCIPPRGGKAYRRARGSAKEAWVGETWGFVGSSVQ